MEVQQLPTLEIGDMAQTKDHKLAHDRMDSMVTVRLSEQPSEETAGQLREEGIKHSEIEQETEREKTQIDEVKQEVEQQSYYLETETSTTASSQQNNLDNTDEDMKLKKHASHSQPTRRNSDDSVDNDGGQVNWEELEKTEGQQPRDQDSDDVSILTSSVRHNN